MRQPMWVLVAAVLPACVIGAPEGSMTPPPSSDDELGGLPTPACGTPCPSHGQCVGCGFADTLCFGPQTQFSLGGGSCTAATPPAGTFAVTVDGTAVTTNGAAAAVDGPYLEIVANGAAYALSLLVPATTPGTTSCATSPTPNVVINYSGAAGASANRPVSGRPPCTITITAVGAVGERVEGTFSAEVTSATGTIALTDGAFSVVRVGDP